MQTIKVKGNLSNNERKILPLIEKYMLLLIIVIPISSLFLTGHLRLKYEDNAVKLVVYEQNITYTYKEYDILDLSLE